MNSGVVLIWDVSAPAETAAAFVEALGEWAPALSPVVGVALHPGLVVVHLHFKAMTSPLALSRLEAEARQAGGRFLDLQHLPEKKVADFRRRFLTPPSGAALRFDSFGEAAQTVRGALRAAASSKPHEAPGPQARPARRYDVLLAVEFKTEADFIREYAANISKGGLFIPTPLRPPVNSQAHLTIGLPNGASLGTIVRVVQLLEHPARGGVGVAFLGDASLRAALEEYLATLTPPTGAARLAS